MMNLLHLPQRLKSDIGVFEIGLGYDCPCRRCQNAESGQRISSQ